MSDRALRRQLPKRPDSLIYETVDDTPPADDYDSFDEFDDDQPPEEYLNISDNLRMKEAPIVPPPIHRPSKDSIAPPATNNFLPSRQIPQPPTGSSFPPAPPASITSKNSQLPALPQKSLVPPPSNNSKFVSPRSGVARESPVPPIPSHTRGHTSFSSADSYQYAHDQNLDDDESNDPDIDGENYEIPDDDIIKSMRKNSISDARNQSAPTKFQRPVLAPPVIETPLQKNISAPPQTASWHTPKSADVPSVNNNSRRPPPVPAIPSIENNNSIIRSKTLPYTKSGTTNEASVSNVDESAASSNSMKTMISERSDGMTSSAWYFPSITREEATRKVKSVNQDGAFLVRKSGGRAGPQSPYSITILCNDIIYNLNIRKRPDGLYALGKEKAREQVFGSVAELVTFHTNNPIDLLATPSNKNVAATVRLNNWPKGTNTS